MFTKTLYRLKEPQFTSLQHFNSRNETPEIMNVQQIKNLGNDYIEVPYL